MTLTKACKVKQSWLRTRRGPQPSEPVAISKMKEISATNREEYGKSKCTCRQYNRNVESGKDFLVQCVKNWQADGGQAEREDGVDTEMLARAFDKRPNKLSVCALEWYMVHKCFVEECKLSVGMVIHAAFAWYWDNM